MEGEALVNSTEAISSYQATALGALASNSNLQPRAQPLGQSRVPRSPPSSLTYVDKGHSVMAERWKLNSFLQILHAMNEQQALLQADPETLMGLGGPQGQHPQGLADPPAQDSRSNPQRGAVP